jgi:hypothetical protein
VLVPCYKEPLEIVVNTINAALGAPMPHGGRRTVRLHSRLLLPPRLLHTLAPCTCTRAAERVCGCARAEVEAVSTTCARGGGVHVAYAPTRTLSTPPPSGASPAPML